VLCVAKNPFAHWHIAGQMQRNEVDKMYLALVAGIVNEERGTVHAPIGRDPDAPHMRIVTPDGDPSVTHYETVARFEKAGATLLRLRLETGRTHQIRVHMKHIGHPLLGDGMYGPDERSLEQSLGIDRQALHAEQLGFAHPRSGERVRYIAPLPGDMRRWIERLKDFEPHDAAADSNK
jgi:23S rRNA pseudouridine1911/1915/1917 synthase